MKVVIKEGRRTLATTKPFTRPTTPPRIEAASIDIQIGIPAAAKTYTAVPESAITAPREKSMQPTTKTRVAPIPRMVKVLVCTRRLSTLRTVKKLFAKIEKIANIITKTARGKNMFGDNPRELQFNRGALFFASESGFLIMLFCLAQSNVSETPVLVRILV